MSAFILLLMVRGGMAQDERGLFATILGGSDVQTIGPGKVLLKITGEGRWAEFTPAWAGGESLIQTGGFLIYVESGADGHQIVDGADPDADIKKGSLKLRKCCEGIEGGFRAPSPKPDDDRDGMVDEDRLDGIDNDGDGAIDEDFAAIGDEMVVTQYSYNGGDGVRVAFHQEAYAWSLPNVDGMIMLALWAKNAGEQPLLNVRIGARFTKQAPFLYSVRYVDVVVPPKEEHSVRVQALVCSERDGTSVALVFMPHRLDVADAWTIGDAYDTNLAAGVEKMITQEKVRGFGMGPMSTFVMPRESSAREKVYVADTSWMCGLSPRIPVLDPGNETRIDVALIGIAERDKINEAIENAVRTFVGDGTHSYLPPPVAMTPRVLWGRYHAVDDVDDAIALEIDDLGDDPITASRISYVSGIQAGWVERREVRPGAVQLILRGDIAEKLIAKNERITLKGRLDTGEFFELVLRPQGDEESVAASARDAARYWKTPGKLDLDLLAVSPNPFREGTTVAFSIPAVVEDDHGSALQFNEPLQTTVKIYNVTGRLVAILEDNSLSPGTYASQWNAVDDQGTPVASGVYYVKLQIERRFLTKRLILLK